MCSPYRRSRTTSIGVVHASRGRGIGTTLLHALIAAAQSGGFPAISLSVEVGNDALRLYERFGFHRVSESDGALTLLQVR